MTAALLVNLAATPPFGIGARWRSVRRTLTDGEFSAIINASWENGPLHTDDVYMASTKFGRRILGGPCLVAICAGLSSMSMYSSWSAAGLDCLAALGIDEVRYVRPVFVGDTVQGDIEVIEFGSTAHGSALKGVIQDTLLNQHNEPVLRMRRSYLLRELE